MNYQNILLNGNEIIAIDCGAAGGLPQHWCALMEVGIFLLFEPDNRSYKNLINQIYVNKDPNRFKIFNKGISSIGKTQKLYRFNMGTGSSLLPPDLSSYTLYKPDNSYVFPIKEIEIETLTLNEALFSLNLDYADLIKIDVQGVELDVIKSLGSEKIQKLLTLEVEVTLIPTYLGQTQLSDICSYLLNNNFEIFDICKWPALWSNRFTDVGYVAKFLGLSKLSNSVLHQIHDLDILFFRKPDEFLQQKDDVAIRKLIVCYCTYGFYVSAFGLIDKAFELNIFSQIEVNLLRESVKEWHTKYHKSFWDSNNFATKTINRILKKLLSLLGFNKHKHWTPQ